MMHQDSLKTKKRSLNGHSSQDPATRPAATDNGYEAKG